jgi:hypothetical protein
MWRCVVLYKLTNIQRYVLPPSSERRLTALIMEALYTSETLVYFYETTWHHIPSSHVQLISPKHFPNTSATVLATLSSFLLFPAVLHAQSILIVYIPLTAHR